MWLAKYKVIMDCARRRLLWPEEVSLKEEIQAKQFTPLPKRLLLRDREVELRHQKDADRRDRAFIQQDKVALHLGCRTRFCLSQPRMRLKNKQGLLFLMEESMNATRPLN